MINDPVLVKQALELNTRRKRREVVRSLINRDGAGCMLCGYPLGEDITIEHWVPEAHGGTNSLPNLALMHVRCNQLLDMLCVSAKILVRDLIIRFPELRLEKTGEVYKRAGVTRPEGVDVMAFEIEDAE